MKKGKFIALEGLDGSGKFTQLKLLAKHLKSRGYNVQKIDFPQYGKKSAGMVEEYLNGKYGTDLDVGCYRGSIFFACDRYDASFKIRKWLKEGNIVISDRYVLSSAGHQGGKIKDKKERTKYLKWLYSLEYDTFQIPKPDIALLLKTSPELAHELSSIPGDKVKKKKRETYLGKKRRDIHENIEHQKNALSSYLEFAKSHPREIKIIDCLYRENLLPPLEIHKKIKEIIEKML